MNQIYIQTNCGRYIPVLWPDLNSVYVVYVNSV